DAQTLEVYKNTLNAKPVLQNLKTYLKDRADLLQTLEEKHKQNHVDIKSNKPAQNQTSTSRSPSCPLCKAHIICFHMTVEKRIEKVSKMNVCSNCLYPGHERKHVVAKSPSRLQSHALALSRHQCCYRRHWWMYLAATFHTARCLLDNGSTSSYVTKNLCTRLNLTLESINGSVSDQLSRFWELDSLSDSQNTDPCDADACEVIFKQTTTRQSDGTDDESTLLEIATGVNTELKKYQFPLRKWKTNCPAVLRKLGFDNDSKDNILKHSTPQSWYYIPSKQNPADIITKCTNAQQLINSDLWFSGPDFLRNDDNKCWPEQPRHLSVSDLPEIRSQSHLTHTDENSFIHNYSNFNKLTRIVAYMLRFVNCCREKQNNSNKNKKLCVGQIKPLNTVELNNARYQLAKIIQQHSFPDEYLLLLNNKKLPVGHKLNSLNPFLDEFQLIHEKTQFWDTLIIYLVASKLDSVTLRHWEVYKNTLNAKPVLQNLKTYLKDRAVYYKLLKKNINKITLISSRTNQLKIKQVHHDPLAVHYAKPNIICFHVRI
ncbi:hypothetical protein HW555_010967, partial [Spodoptera exigua]